MNKQTNIIHAVNNLKDGEEMALTTVSSKKLKDLFSSKSKTKKPHAFQRTKHVSASMQSLLGRMKSPEKPKNATEIPKNSQTESLVMATQEEVEAIMDAVIRSFSHDKSITFSEIEEVGWEEQYVNILSDLLLELYSQVAGATDFQISNIESFDEEMLSEIENSLVMRDENFEKNFDIFVSALEARKKGIINFDLGKIHHPAIRAVALHIDKNSDNFYKNFDVNFNFSK